MVYAPAADHFEIAKLIDSPDNGNEPPITERIALTTLDATKLTAILQDMYGDSHLGAPFLVATETNALVAHGTKAQIADVKLAIKALALIPAR